MRKARILLFSTVLTTLLAGSLTGGRLFRLRTGNTLSENDVQIRMDYEYSGYENVYINRYALDLNYGIADGVDFTFTFPLYSLGGISDSLVIGDLLFDILFRIKDWMHPTKPVLSSLFVYLGFQVGVGLAADEGKPNPDTGTKQTYYPFVNGLSQLYLGVGYSTPLGPLEMHLNLEWFNETRDDESVTDFKLGNDHLSFRGGVSWYTEKTIRIFGGSFNIGFKPFYEAAFRFSFGSESGMPSRLDNLLGVWLRLGSVFRISTGYSFPVPLTGDRFMEREFLFSLSAVFR